MTQLTSQKGDIQSCIDQCMNCYEVCTRTLAAGLEINEDQDFITALQLCSQACQLAAQALLLDSAFYTKTCALCADLCDAVALICENFDENEMKHCGEVCSLTSKTCRGLIAHAVSPQAMQSDIRLV